MKWLKFYKSDNKSLLFFKHYSVLLKIVKCNNYEWEYKLGKQKKLFQCSGT